MSKFTKGPWKIDKYGNLKVNGDYVRFSGLCLSTASEGAANTTLISAAPDMHEELKSYISLLNALIDDGLTGYIERRNKALAALNKADGKA